MQKFEQGDKVLQRGTTSPIMEIYGAAIIKNLPPPHTIKKGYYICEWKDKSNGIIREEFNEDELDLVSNTQKEDNS